ncbi:MAG: tetratricopeptide repeat protein [Microcystaceae cyanobacterium]
MTQLSLCMIVKNEEETLPNCLKSAQGLVDEMVVVDTGSTDRTVDIAKELGATVPSITWPNDFAIARNEALKFVSGDWILVLDADENLSQEIIPDIKKAIEAPDNLVINLIRHEIGAIQSPYSLVSRLFRKHPQLEFSRPYHAMIDDSVSQLLKEESHWQIIDLPEIAIQHYGYQPEAISALNKSQRAKEAMEGFLKNNPYDSYTCNKLGALYLQMGQKKKGVKLLKQGLKSNKSTPIVLFELHYHLANAYKNEQNMALAVKHYQKAINQPILPSLKLGAYNNVGGLFQSIGDLGNAEQAYQTAISIDPTFATGYYNLGMAWKARGQLKQAIAAYQEAIKYNPNYAEAYQNLGVVLYKMGDLGNSIEVFNKAIALHEKNNPSEATRLRQGLKEIGLETYLIAR